MKRILGMMLLPVLGLSGAEKPVPVRSDPAYPAAVATSNTNNSRRLPVPAIGLADSAVGEAVRLLPAKGRRLVYRPPRVGLPEVTVACGTRGQGADRLQLSVLAPEHVGWTSQAAPVLFWHRTGPMVWPLEATLVVPGRAEPILQIPLTAAGEWHRLDLAEHHVDLEPGITYHWAVAAIIDPSQRSKDLVAAGAICRVVPSAEAQARLTELSNRDGILEYARDGFWYDAVSILAAELERTPQDAELWQWCAALCEQGGLTELAQRVRAGYSDRSPKDSSY